MIEPEERHLVKPPEDSGVGLLSAFGILGITGL